MPKAIARRELIILDGLGDRLQGTFHRPECGVSAASVAANRVGVLFVNSLSLPRAASGDSAVYWADAIAALGYPTFRIDLPGLGDSGGQASTDLLDRINDGAFAPVIAAATEELANRFRLPGVVVFGHCAGSVSAVYAGAASTRCKGLILMDPYFHLPQAKRPRLREELSGWARRNRLGGMLSNGLDRARNAAMKLRGNAPPRNANLPLLTCWKRVATAGMPLLLLKAPGIKAQGAKLRKGDFDYIDYVMKMAGRRNRVSSEFVEGADHSFANRVGREAVQRHIADWLKLHFPLTHTGEKYSGDSASNAGHCLKESHSAAEEHSCAVESR